MLLVVAPLTVVYVFITGISSVNIQIVKGRLLKHSIQSLYKYYI